MHKNTELNTRVSCPPWQCLSIRRRHVDDSLLNARHHIPASKTDQNDQLAEIDRNRSHFQGFAPLIFHLGLFDTYPIWDIVNARSHNLTEKNEQMLETTMNDLRSQVRDGDQYALRYKQAGKSPRQMEDSEEFDGRHPEWNRRYN